MFNGNNKKRNESWNNHNQQPHNLTQNRFPSIQSEHTYINQNVFNCDINQPQQTYHHAKEYPIIAGNKAFYPDYHPTCGNPINYEFVNNSYANIHGGEPSQASEEYILFAQQQQQQQMNAAMSHENFKRSLQYELEHHKEPAQTINVHNATNMLINQFVGNWTPNVSGTYTPFGETGIKLSELSKMNEQPQSVTVQATQALINEPAVMQNTNIVHAIDINPPSSDVRASTFIKQPASVQHIHQEIKKPRIVAEVKPMRMSYSDVLSKNVINEKKGDYNAYNNYNINSINQNDSINGSTNKMNKVLHDKNKYINSISTNQPTNAAYEKKSTSNISYISDEKESLLPKIKKSHGNSAKLTNSDSMTSNGMPKYIKKVYPVVNDEKGGRIEENNKENPMPINNPTKKQNKLKGKNKNMAQYTEFDKKKDQRYNYQQQSSEDENLSSYEQQNYEYSYYNVTETNGINNNHTYEKQSSSSSSTASSYVALAAAAAASSASGACSKQSHIIKRKNATTRYNNKIDKNLQQSQQQTVLTNSSLTHQTNNKRCNRTNNKKNNKKYAYFIKLCEKWLEFMLKILTWFKALLSDIVFLSFGIVWEKLNSGYEYSINCYQSIKIELKNNSGFPMTLFKKCYKRFDAYFTKNSKWAFWRNIYRKKIHEQPNDFYKDGRLPQTGDEAMYSLLNCKGKDAYSILGVTQECTQELIRKHYKKLAVLVHPDKNKQPGAEEAFKILQRAFELIGEPENRKNYDQSLAEVLNAEKAWSELNDLLTQLHTKIVEAANTIRCSSCSLRHPRKPTGRPHYAARECASCKIRHSAREGDIWAETTFFGLRWKYLALMEGNVYDITEWANCQRGALTHLQPNAHLVQYRIVLGGQQQQQAQQPHHQQQQNNQQQHQQDKEKLKRDQTTNEPNLDEFLNNLYKGSKQQPPSSTHHASNRKRSKKN